MKRLILAVVLLSALGCGGGGGGSQEPPLPDGFVKLAPETQVMLASSGVTFERTSPTRMVVRNSPKPILAGQILASDSDDGVLVKVVDVVTSAGGETEVEVEETTLADAITEADFSAEAPIEPDDVGEIVPEEGTTYQWIPDPTPNGRGVTDAPTLQFTTGFSFTAGDTVIPCTLTTKLKPVFYTEFVRGSSGTSFEAGIKPTFEFRVSLLASPKAVGLASKIEYEREVQIGRLGRVRSVFLVFGFPVVLVTDAEVVAKVQLKFDWDLEPSFVVSIAGKAGVGVTTVGGLRAYSVLDMTFNPELRFKFAAFNGQLKVNVPTLRVSTKLYGAAGPAFDLGPYADVTMQGSLVPPRLRVDASAGAELGGGISVHKVLTKLLSDGNEHIPIASVNHKFWEMDPVLINPQKGEIVLDPVKSKELAR